jgi:hypothetical protein
MTVMLQLERIPGDLTRGRLVDWHDVISVEYDIVGERDQRPIVSPVKIVKTYGRN